MKKKEFLTETKRKAIIADKEKAIIESFSKIYGRIKRLDEESYPDKNESFEELFDNFKRFNQITDDVEGLKEYIKMAKMREDEAMMDDSEYSMNLWNKRRKAAEDKLSSINPSNDDTTPSDIKWDKRSFKVAEIVDPPYGAYGMIYGEDSMGNKYTVGASAVNSGGGSWEVVEIDKDTIEQV